MIHTKTSYPRRTGQRWRACQLCGPQYSRVELMFTTGSVAPVVGELLTGGTSGHYGTVVQVEVESGTWAGGTADGRVELSSASGLNEDGEIFTSGETITGSSGAALVADQKGWVQKYGIMHPENEMTKASDHKWYCKQHFLLRFGQEGIDDAKIDISERERTVS